MRISSLLIVIFGWCPGLLLAQEIDSYDPGPSKAEEEGFRTYYRNYDSSVVHTRMFDPEKVSALKADAELNYGYTRTAVSLWDSFQNWLSRLLRNLFSTKARDGRWFDFFLFTAVALIVVYVIMRLLKINHMKLFYGTRARKATNPFIIEENIHEIDFETLLKEAVTRKEYRKAIRLTYLLSLKLLADKHYIEWEPGKTNHDYLNELSNQQLKPDFHQLNYYFEYAWYGNFAITSELFARVDALFSNWKRKL